MNKLSINDLLYTYLNNSEFILDAGVAEYTFGKPLGIYGLSGSGKSTFGKLIAGLIEPKTGEIIFSEQKEDSIEQMNIIYSSQFPENIFLGNSIKHTIDSIKKYNQMLVNLEERIKYFLKEFGVDLSDIYNYSGYELSNGELRRFAISLGFACSPKLLILDEPTIGLDTYGNRQLEIVVKEYGLPVILISHDFALIEKICGDIWIFDKGHFAFSGNISELNDKKELLDRVGIKYYKDFKNKIKEKHHEFMDSFDF